MKTLTSYFALALAGFFLPAISNAAESGKVTLIAGDVKAIPAGGGAEAVLERGDVVQVGTVIQTGGRGRVVIMMTDSSAIRIGPNSDVVVAMMTDNGADGQSQVKVDVRAGSVGALIDSSKGRKIDFRIQTPHGVATARGTFYGVVVDEDKTYTKVEKGTVSVTANKAEDAN